MFWFAYPRAQLAIILAEQEPRMTITITAFERSPDGGKGLARDTRVRWALEEVGQPYDVRLLSFARDEGARASRAAPVRPDSDLSRKTVLACSRRARSSSTSPSAIRACCQPTPMPGRARSPGCSPLSARSSRRSSTCDRQDLRGRQALGGGPRAAGRGPHSRPARRSFRPASAMPTGSTVSSAPAT